MENVRKSFFEARKWWNADPDDRDHELVDEIGEVALSAAEDGDWGRSLRAAKAAAREAEDYLGYPDPGWTAFLKEIERANEIVQFNRVTIPDMPGKHRTVAAMSAGKSRG